jgi:hypothetical protein
MNLWEFLVAAGAGLAAAVAWAVMVEAFHRGRQRKNYKHLGGAYESTRKFPSAISMPEHLEIVAKANRLTVRRLDAPEGDWTQGKIAMNERLHDSGQGHYANLKCGEQLFGFWDVQVLDDDTLLVHTTYANADDGMVMQGYIWRRISHGKTS